MNFDNSTALSASFLVLFLALIVIFFLYERYRKGGRNLRELKAFTRLHRAVGRAVENGSRMHVTLGSGDMAGEQNPVGLAALGVLKRATRTALISDCPPVVSCGNGALSILSQDVLSNAYRAKGATQQEAYQSRLIGITPFSYAAGSLSITQDENVTASILTGHLGPEAVLIAEAAERTNGFTLAGTDHLPGQAVLYATTKETLIGEEVFAGGAYLRTGKVHTASLRAQDVLRWLIISAIILGGLLRMI